MATITQQYAEAVERIKALETDLSQANATVTQNETAIKALTGERDTAKAEVTKLSGELATANDTITKIKTDLTAASAEIEKLKGEAKTAHQIAGERLADISAPAVGKLADDVQPTAEEVLSEYKKLQEKDPNAANQFYDKHRAILCPDKARAKV